MAGEKETKEAVEKEEKPAEEAGKKEEIRYIVRIASKDLDGSKPIHQALRGVTGASHRFARVAALAFEKESGTAFDLKLGIIPEEQDKLLEDIVLNPMKHGIPVWMANTRKDWETGKDMHLVMGDLEFSLRQNIKRLNEMKTYRGLRHSWGLPVRGQRTRSSFRGKGKVVGVFKKDAKAGRAAAEKQQTAKKSGKAEK